MALFKRKDSKYYWSKFTLNGKLHQFSTKVKNRQAALQVEAAKRLEIATGIKEPDPAPTLQKACDDFIDKVALERSEKTVQRYEGSIKPILKYFGGKTMCDKITPEKVEKFKHYLVKYKSPKTKRALQPGTINNILTTFRMIMNRLVDLDVLTKNPARKIKTLIDEMKTPRILNFDEQKIYLFACSEPLKSVAVLMIELGLRPSEALSLTRDDVSLDENFIQIQKGKTKSARRKLPLSFEARKVLEYRLRTIESENLFPGVSVIDLDHLHTKALKAIGIERFTDDYFVLYSLRHCFASRHTENQTDPVTLSELLGHADLKTLKRYAHPSFEHKVEAIRRMEKNAKAV